MLDIRNDQDLRNAIGHKIVCPSQNCQSACFKALVDMTMKLTLDSGLEHLVGDRAFCRLLKLGYLPIAMAGRPQPAILLDFHMKVSAVSFQKVGKYIFLFYLLIINNIFSCI